MIGTRITHIAACFAAALSMSACASTTMKPITTVTYVDLKRFMGDWYVIASIPTFFEKGAYNAVESYRLDSDGTVATTFTYRADAFDGKVRRYTPRGFVMNRTSNAVWGMQFIWPIKSDYRIAYLAPDYAQTVIARNKRDYVWIMARTPQIAETDYQRLLQFVGDQGYDVNLVQRVPQQWN